MRATATFADPCTGARKSTDGSGANSPRGIDHGQSGEAHVPPRWSGHRGRLVAPDESARFWKATPFRAVARVSRYVPLRFTSRDTRRASHDPHEKGTGGSAELGSWRRCRSHRDGPKQERAFLPMLALPPCPASHAARAKLTSPAREEVRGSSPQAGRRSMKAWRLHSATRVPSCL